MHTQVYQIRALSNLHPGSGDNDYGIVDKLVQRDPTTNYPTIHMSSMKGAIREYFSKITFSAEEIATLFGEGTAANSKSVISRLFGSEPQAPADEVQQGRLRFISSELLALPKPSNTGFAVRFVPDDVLQWMNKVALFTGGTSVAIDDKGWKDISTGLFSRLAEELPVIARNYLDDGQSKNLWYEEFIPREAVFGTLVQGPEAALALFNKYVHNTVIQIGGNATVGYGYCLFTSIVK